MIKGIFILNNNGDPRIIKFYEDVPSHERAALIQKIFLLVSRRSDSQCNFLDSSSLVNGFIVEGKDWAANSKILYRHYATLYFIFVCEETESELGILDLIQVFVESLDKCFENVCELDLVFNCERVHFILDEIVLGGLVMETNMSEILHAVGDMQKLEKPVNTGNAASTKLGELLSGSRLTTNISGR